MVNCPAETAETAQLMASGKRHFICGDVQDAIDSFSQACEGLAKKYGETHERLATPYLYYGKCLLEMARIENGVLGNAVRGGSALAEKDDVEDVEKDNSNSSNIEIEEDELPAEKRAELRSHVEDAMGPGNLYNEENVEGGDTSQDEEEEEHDEKEEEEDNEPEEKMDEDPPMQKIEEDKEVSFATDKREEEEVTNMQLAWEMLEMAFNIFKRLGPDACLKQAECKHLLGQVSMEKENYCQAAEDFIECYEQQRGVLIEGDRRTAEACYNVGLAYSFDRKFKEAIDWYRKAVSALECRITHLEGKLKMLAAEEYDTSDSVESEQRQQNQKEMDELKDLVVLDMRAKIEDVELSMKQYTESINVMKTMGKDVFSGSGGFDNGFDAPKQETNGASDIQHKIVKKRKSDAESPAELKKMRNGTDPSAIQRAEQHA